MSELIRMRIEGPFFRNTSVSHVNREMAAGLLRSGRVELSLAPTERNEYDPRATPAGARLADLCFKPLTGPADVHLRYSFPPRFERPDEGHFVLMQPWEYGVLPRRWIEPIRDYVSEVWCISRYVQEVYRASGIAEEKLKLMPHGIDPAIFRPDGLKQIFSSEVGADRIAGREPFLFLWVGGTIVRKGFDRLLEAYTRAFTPYDDVCLVIKDSGTRTVYHGANAKDRVLELIRRGDQPPMVYLDEDLDPQALARMYRACHCLAAPYRGEGFCLPALEAMACGLPVIVPAGGATDDFVDETVGWRTQAARKPMESVAVGEFFCVGQPWMLEVDRDDLARTLRAVAANPQEARRRGKAAAERALAGWTWGHAVAAALYRIEELRSLPPLPKTPVGHRSFHAQRGGPALETEAVDAQESISAPESMSAQEGISGQEAVEVSLRRRDGAGREKPGKGKNKAKMGKDGSEAGAAGERSLALRAPARISLCMIARNEAARIGACLRSIRKWVDEMIVVDTGSTDRTRAIARSYGARVYDFPWCDSFAAARNESCRYARHEWIFWMDADDVIPEECGRALREVAFTAEDETFGFTVDVRFPPAPGEPGATEVTHIKLYRNRPDLCWTGRIHEQILASINEAGGRVVKTTLYVVHENYDRSPEGQQLKREREDRLLALDLEERPLHPFTHFNVGMTRYHRGESAEAIPFLESSLELGDPGDSTTNKLYAMLANSHLRLGQRDLAMSWVERGLALYPRDPELLHVAGAVYVQNGRLADAETTFVRLLTAAERPAMDSLDTSVLTYRAHYNLGIVYREMSREAAALSQFQRAVEIEPRWAPGWLALGETHLAARRFQDARAVAARLRELDAPAAQSLLRRLGD